jgi:hypothetical protein
MVNNSFDINKTNNHTKNAQHVSVSAITFAGYTQSQAVECAWLDWCNLIVAQVTTKYKIPTKNYVNIRPNKHNESPKSKHAQPDSTYGKNAQHISVSAITFTGYTQGSTDCK